MGAFRGQRLWGGVVLVRELHVQNVRGFELVGRFYYLFTTETPRKTTILPRLSWGPVKPSMAGGGFTPYGTQVLGLPLSHSQSIDLGFLCLVSEWMWGPSEIAGLKLMDRGARHVDSAGSRKSSL